VGKYFQHLQQPFLASSKKGKTQVTAPMIKIIYVKALIMVSFAPNEKFVKLKIIVAMSGINTKIVYSNKTSAVKSKSCVVFVHQSLYRS
jgi:hypothetical protein